MARILQIRRNTTYAVDLLSPVGQFYDLLGEYDLAMLHNGVRLSDLVVKAVDHQGRTIIGAMPSEEGAPEKAS